VFYLIPSQVENGSTPPSNIGETNPPPICNDAFVTSAITMRAIFHQSRSAKIAADNSMPFQECPIRAVHRAVRGDQQIRAQQILVSCEGPLQICRASFLLASKTTLSFTLIWMRLARTASSAR
jgi:hypothetical protein